MRNSLTWITTRTPLFIRIVLSLVFLGHGLVSLGFSPSQALHLKIIEGMNHTDLPSTLLLKAAGWFDITLAALFLLNFGLKWTVRAALAYLIGVVIAVINLYYIKTGSIMGIAELLRRGSWILLVIFLLFTIKGHYRYFLIRLSSASAFIAHGTASLGFFGFNQAHVEIASQLIPEDFVRQFILISGCSDLLIGTALLFAFQTRTAALLGCIWIFAVVVLSSLVALPDGIFRAGFLMVAFYNYIDSRTSYNKTYPAPPIT